jgi:hypothetical protein
LQVQPAILTSPSSGEDIAGLRFEFLFKFAGLKKTALSNPPREDIAGFCVIWIKTCYISSPLREDISSFHFFQRTINLSAGQRGYCLFLNSLPKLLISTECDVRMM